MKRAIAVIIFLLNVAIFIKANAVSDIRNTKHNLANWGVGTYVSTNYTEVCIFCHTPHNAITTPLWNRDYTSSGFTTYSSSKFNVTNFDGSKTDIDSASKLCMSCHESSNYWKTINLKNYSKFVSGGITFSGTNIRTSAVIGQNLRDDHPIGFNYVKAQQTFVGKIKQKSAVEVVLGLDTFKGDIMGCSSCHSVHGKVINGSFTPAFLRTTNASSNLCLACHIK